MNKISILYQKYVTQQELHNQFPNNYEELSNNFYNEFKKNNEFNKFINKCFVLLLTVNSLKI